MREPVGGVPHLGYDRVQQAYTKVAHLARVSGRRDCKTFSFALTCHFVSIFPRVPQYTVCLFLIPFCFFQLHGGSRGETCCIFPNSQSFLVTLWWALCSPVLFQVVCLHSLFVSACRTRALTRTNIWTQSC